ncbi:MAG: AAA family ATPase [Lachnospira sp.]|nr:AAA family ATPase [Lachnospira sp.]
MPRVVATGAQDFEQIISNHCFYVDKSLLIKEWWERQDSVTLITRPRRFGKTLNISMLDCFFSTKYEGRGDLFEGLDIWKEEKYHVLQGSYPVISLSFAGVKENTYDEVRRQIIQILTELYSAFYFLRDCGKLNEKDKEYFDRVGIDMGDADAAKALNRLSDYLYRYYGKKVIILLDEYDTPLQEAYVGGYWEQLVSFTRSLFNNTFETNPYMERAIMTGITRVSRESMFLDLNNLKVVTTSSDAYATCFGFMEEEVFSAMDEFGMDNRDEVKSWYDGFTFGSVTDIYNPWSITNMLDTGKLKTYWANTSSNSLAGSLIRQGSQSIKMQFERLLMGETITCVVDEEIVYGELGQNAEAVWSLLLASGYLKSLDIQGDRYELALTNYETKKMFEKLVSGWFGSERSNYNDFIKALLLGDVKAMNAYMNRMTLAMFRSFDVGNRPSGRTEPERFYHGFVLGLLVELKDRYKVTSNRESGFGRYDVMLVPLQKEDDGIILEFKVHDSEDETDLKDTVKAALKQIDEKHYEQVLLDEGVEAERIRKYGFAFEGKQVLIG